MLEEKYSCISDLEREISSLRELCNSQKSAISEFQQRCLEQAEALAAAKEADERLASLTKEQERVIEQTNSECARLIQEAAAQREQMVEQARAQAAPRRSRFISFISGSKAGIRIGMNAI